MFIREPKIHCAGCALKVTRTFDEWLSWRAEARGDGSLYHYADASATFCDRRINRLGVAIMRCSDDAKRTLERIQPKSRKMKPVLVEHDTRCWCYVRLSPTMADYEKLIEALHDRYDFELLLATDTDKRPWTTRLRSGLTPAARKAARWTEDRHFCVPHALEVLDGGHFRGEAMDFVVLSARAHEGEKIAVFASSLVQAIAEALDH